MEMLWLIPGISWEYVLRLPSGNSPVFHSTVARQACPPNDPPRVAASASKSRPTSYPFGMMVCCSATDSSFDTARNQAPVFASVPFCFHTRKWLPPAKLSQHEPTHTPGEPGKSKLRYSNSCGTQPLPSPKFACCRPPRWMCRHSNENPIELRKTRCVPHIVQKTLLAQNAWVGLTRNDGINRFTIPIANELCENRLHTSNMLPFLSLGLAQPSDVLSPGRGLGSSDTLWYT